MWLKLCFTGTGNRDLFLICGLEMCRQGKSMGIIWYCLTESESNICDIHWGEKSSGEAFYNLWCLWNFFRILLKHHCRLLLWQNFDRRCWSITKKVLPAWAASTSFWCIISSIIFNFLSHWSIRQRNFSQKQLASPNANWEIFSLHYGGSNQGIAGCQFFIGSPHWAQNLDFLL